MDALETTSGAQAADQMQQQPDPLQNVQPSAADSAAAPAAASPAGAPAAAPAAAPAPAPAAPSGIAGVMGSVLDMLQTRDRPNVSRDDQGNRVVTQGAPMSRGQQIAAIALTALKGATTAAAAPSGPNHVGAGVAGAVGQAISDQQGAAHLKDENADHDFAVKQKAKMDNINYQLLTRQNTADQFDLQNREVKAGRESIDFADGLAKREADLGSYDLGVFKDEHDLPNVMAKQPQFMQKLYKEQGIIAVPVFDGDGNRQGVHIYERKPDTNAQLAPEGAIAHKFVPGAKPGDPPSMQPFQPVGATNGDIDRYNLKAMADSQGFYKQQADINEKTASAREANAKADATPAETAAKTSEAQSRRIEATSSAAHNYASAAKEHQETAQMGGADGASSDDSIVKGMLNNSLDIRTISSLRKDRREQLVRQAMAADPNWNEKKYEAAMDTVKDFSEPSGKGYQSIQSLNRFTGHAAGLVDTFAELRNSNSPMLNKPLNAIKTGMLGNTAMTDVHQYIDAAGNEHMNYLLNGRAPHSEDVKAREQSLNANMTPAQIEGVIKSDARIQLTQLGAMNQRHIQTVGRPAYGMIDPATKQIYQKLGLEGFARNELGDAYDGNPNQPVQQQHQQAQQAQSIPSNHPQQAAAAGVPAGAQAGYQNGQLVGYQDASGWHSIGGK